MAQINKTGMTELWGSSPVYGESAAWLESMYETYLSTPDKLEAKWRQYFDGMAKENEGVVNGNAGNGRAGQDFDSIELEREVSPREMHDYFVNYAQQKHTRGYQAESSFDHEKKQVQVLQLINAYRFRGHQIANLNPLGGRRETDIAELSLQYHGLTDDDMETLFETG